VAKGELGGVQVVAGVAGKGAATGRGDAAGRVERVSDERMPRGGQMDSDLVGPAGRDANG